MSRTVLDRALGYAQHGLYVIPVWNPIPGGCECGPECDSPGKHPKIKAWETLATTDPRQLDAWLKAEPRNIGIVCGLSGLATIDIDPRNGGQETFAALIAELGPLPLTVTADSGGGGQHLVFRRPAGDLGGKLGRGVDFLHDGRQFLVEPSVHPSGGHYRWRAGMAPGEIAISELPASWIEFVLKDENEPAPRPTTNPTCDDFYEVLRAMDQRYVLGCISGTWLVNGEVFTFKPTRRGKWNLLINGKGTKGFIDSRGEIGGHGDTGSSSEGPDGGHCVSTWCRYYGHTDKRIREGLIDYVPELARWVEERKRRAKRDDEPRPGDIDGNIGTDNSADVSPPPADDVPHAADAPQDEVGARRRKKRAKAAPADLGASSHAGLGPQGGYRLTDAGNARRFADQHAARLRYIHPWKSWLTWDGRRWRRDNIGTEYTAAKEVVAAIYADAAAAHAKAAAAVNSGDPTFTGAPVTEMSKHAQDSAKRSRMDAMIALARSEPEIAAAPDAFDRDRYLLNVRNGTIDLRTGDLRPHRPTDMITMLADVDYDPKADAPEWKRFFAEVMPDAQIANWIWRFLGYALTGDVGEQVFPFWLGKGGNGKNVCADAVVATLGDYAMVGAPDLLLEKRGETHPTDLVDLDGKRLVICSEIEPGRAWAESRIKQITGDRHIKARGMKENFRQFEATSKLVVLANTKPRVKSTDDGLWRRMMLVPWTVQIPKEKQDKKLLERLIENERPGILAWLVRGCLAWRQHGLGTAKAIDVATAGYRRDQDVIGLWIADCCRIDADAECTTKTLYQSYTAWCEGEGIDRTLTRNALRARLLERDGITEKRTAQDRGLAGIRPLNPGEALDGGMTK